MTPFGSELHARIQSMFAPKNQLKAASYGSAPADAGAERTIQSDAPIAPEVAAPAPQAQPAPADNPITAAVEDLGPAPRTEGRPMPAIPEAPPLAPVEPGPKSPGLPPEGSTYETRGFKDPAMPTPDPTPAPPAPQVQATPEVAYTDMYQEQQARSAALRAFLQARTFHRGGLTTDAQ